MRFSPKFLGLIYVAIGIFVAANKDYFENLDTLKRVGSAVLGILLWPLLCSASTSISSNRLLLTFRYNPPPWPATDFVSTYRHVSGSARPRRGACASRA